MHHSVKETKTIQTKNDTKLIDEMNKREELFFWNVQNVQITHIQDSHVEFRDKAFVNAVEVTTVTETTQYATITYERDKLIPLYNEVVAMEREYCDLEEHIQKVLAGKKYPNLILGLIIIIVMIFVIGLIASATVANIVSVFAILYPVYVAYMRLVYNRKIDKQVEDELYPQLEEKESRARKLYSRVVSCMKS